MAATLKPLRVEHETMTFSNGLKVIAHEDHGSPVVAVHLMYHAGSKDERQGRTGLAHLLEHLLFEGSAHCPKGEFDKLLERVGGTNNGSTWLDRTNYYEVVPSHAVELALWLERDRMAHFLPVLDSEMLEVQRSVVINERKQAYENRPYGLANERLQQLLFPPEHPYSWPTIGYTADLEAMTLQDARSFYQRYYAPDNAVLVLAGDLESERAFAWAEKYFGDVPPSGIGQAVGSANGHPPAQGGIEVMYDRVSFPRLYLAYAVPPYGTRAWVHLDVLSYLLADGESSRLQRRLIREGELAQDVDTYLYPTESAGIFGMVATSRTGVTAETLRAEFDAVLQEVISPGMLEGEVAGAIRRARRDQLNALATVEDRAEELAYAATVLGDARRLEEVLDAYASVTVEDVQAAAATLLGRDLRAEVIVLPNGEAPVDD
jgi:zinc protease